MQNPFEIITQRLENLEGLVLAIKQSSEQEHARQERSESGGIELAETVTGLSRGTLYKLTCTRAIPHHKKGGKLYFFRDELVAWIREGSRTPVETETFSQTK